MPGCLIPSLGPLGPPASPHCSWTVHLSHKELSTHGKENRCPIPMNIPQLSMGPVGLCPCHWSAGKAKAGMVHSVSECMRGVQVKLWDPLRTRAIPERLKGVLTTRRYTNPHLPYWTVLSKVDSVTVTTSEHGLVELPLFGHVWWCVGSAAMADC